MREKKPRVISLVPSLSLRSLADQTTEEKRFERERRGRQHHRTARSGGADWRGIGSGEKGQIDQNFFFGGKSTLETLYLSSRGNPSSDSFEVVEGSMEKLNLETAVPASSRSDKSDMNDDDFDLWGEDEESNNVTDDGLRRSSELNRDWKWRHEQFHTMGYRDGITAGKEASAQEGFDVGFKQSVRSGYNWGLLRGISSAYASLPDHLKEKLVATAEKRDKLQKLYQSGQMISTTDALKMFHESIQHTETKKETLESNPHLLTDNRESSRCIQLDSLVKELVSLLDDLPEIVAKIDPGQENAG